MGKKSSLAIPQQKNYKSQIFPTCEEMNPSGKSPAKALIFTHKEWFGSRVSHNWAPYLSSCMFDVL